MTHAKNVKKAAGFIYLSLVLGLPNLALGEMYNSDVSFGFFEVASALILMGLIAGLAYQVGREKNWAIWTYTILCIFGLVGIGTIAQAFERNFLYGMVGAAQWGIQMVALFLIHETALQSLLGLNPRGHAAHTFTADREPGLTVSAVAARAQDVGAVGQLSQLHELLKSGAITRDEYEQQKRKVLSDAA